MAAASAVLRQQLLLVATTLVVLMIAPEHAVADASGRNFMLSGETLPTGDELVWDKYRLAMQHNCDLVLQNGDWESHTAWKGTNCRLKLFRNGDLSIFDGAGSVVWSSGNSSVAGDYAAMIHPEGAFVVYGPVVWRFPPFVKAAAAGSSSRSRTTAVPAMANIRHEKNALFSGQSLYGDGGLHAGSYELTLEDCKLVLIPRRNDFQSGTTQAARENCYLRLDHYGGLRIRNDRGGLVWWNDVTAPKEGHYVLLLNEDGSATVRGPAIWSTKELRIENEAK